jgi:hypothetical protein
MIPLAVVALVSLAGSGDGDSSRGLFGTVIRFTSSDCTT